MPTKTVAAALIEAYFDLQHAPWTFSTWKQLTGVPHGLFPSDDGQLPHQWTRQTATDVWSFFQQYNQLPTEKERDKFIKKGEHPGRMLWVNWVQKHWESWGIHDLFITHLKEASAHPFQIMLNDDSTDWPNSANQLPKAEDAIGMALFGPDAFPPTSTSLPSRFHSLYMAFGNRCWARTRAKVKNDLKKLEQYKVSIAADFKAIQALETPPKKQLLQVLRDVKKLKDLCQLYSIEKNRVHIEEVEDMLNDMLISVGVGVQPRKGPVKTRAAPTKAPQRLASEEDMLELQGVYDAYFGELDASTSEPPLHDLADAELQEALGKADSDALGMDEEAKMSIQQLDLDLGTQHGLTFQCNTVRHPDGYTLWTNPDSFNSNTPPLVPHWHQIVGVRSIVRHVMSTHPAKRVPNGMLIADEVGLGKTLLCLLFVAWVNQVLYLLSLGRPGPPIYLRHQFIRRGETLLASAHIIITPGTLKGQWRHDIEVTFRPHSIEIFDYNNSEKLKRDTGGFWSPTGPFFTSKHQPQHKIILVSQTDLRQDFQYVYGPLPKKRESPWEMPKRIRPRSGTLFDHRFCTAIFDEAHEYRKEGIKHLSALLLSQCAQLNLIVTGTPLHTSPKDVVSLSRLVGTPYYFGSNGVSEVRDDLNNLFKARKDGSSSRLLQLQIEITRRYQRNILPNMLRRRPDTLDWRGNRLIQLLPVERFVVIVRLTEREKAIIQKIAESVKEDGNTANEHGFWTVSFYIEYRMAVGYAKENAAVPNPKFRTMAEWLPVMSTKMNTTAQLLEYLLADDRVAKPTCDNGELTYPPLPTTKASQPRPQTRKVIIVAIFPSISSILRNVLNDVYGIATVYIDGNMSFERRDAMIAKFKDPAGPRVLIMSAVGTIGLNLTVANVVIFLDQLWSSQDERQAIARVDRQPQEHVVWVFHILAADTTDVLMNKVARGKSFMFDAFMNAKLGKELDDILSGKTVYDADDDLDDLINDSDSDKKPDRKGKGRAKPKPVASTADAGLQSDVGNVSAKGASKKGKGKRKSMTAPSDEVPSAAVPGPLLTAGGQAAKGKQRSKPDPKTTKHQDPVEPPREGEQHKVVSKKVKGGLQVASASDSDEATLAQPSTSRKGAKKKVPERKRIVSKETVSHSDDEFPSHAMASGNCSVSAEERAVLTAVPRLKAVSKVRLGSEDVEMSGLDTNLITPPPFTPNLLTPAQNLFEMASDSDVDIPGPSDSEGVTSLSEPEFSLGLSASSEGDNDFFLQLPTASRMARSSSPEADASSPLSRVVRRRDTSAPNSPTKPPTKRARLGSLPGAAESISSGPSKPSIPRLDLSVARASKQRDRRAAEEFLGSVSVGKKGVSKREAHASTTVVGRGSKSSSTPQSQSLAKANKDESVPQQGFVKISDILAYREQKQREKQLSTPTVISRGSKLPSQMDGNATTSTGPSTSGFNQQARRPTQTPAQQSTVAAIRTAAAIHASVEGAVPASGTPTLSSRPSQTGGRQTIKGLAQQRKLPTRAEDTGAGAQSSSLSSSAQQSGKSLGPKSRSQLEKTVPQPPENSSKSNDTAEQARPSSETPYARPSYRNSTRVVEDDNEGSHGFSLGRKELVRYGKK